MLNKRLIDIFRSTVVGPGGLFGQSAYKGRHLRTVGLPKGFRDRLKLDVGCT